MHVYIFFFYFSRLEYVMGLGFLLKKASSHGFIFISRKGSVNFFFRYCLRRIFFREKKYIRAYNVCIYISVWMIGFQKIKLPVLSVCSNRYMTTKYSWVLDSQTPDSLTKKECVKRTFYTHTCFCSIHIIP